MVVGARFAEAYFSTNIVSARRATRISRRVTDAIGLAVLERALQVVVAYFSVFKTKVMTEVSC